MKIFKLLILTVAAISINMTSTAQKEQNDRISGSLQSSEIEVLYFHYTRRCITCQAIEDVTREAIAEIYGDEVNFIDYNLDDKEGKQKAKEIGISGQTLLIVGGNTQLNITNEGFMLARNNPEKLKKIITEKIDPLL